MKGFTQLRNPRMEMISVRHEFPLGNGRFWQLLGAGTMRCFYSKELEEGRRRFAEYLKIGCEPTSSSPHSQKQGAQ